MIESLDVTEAASFQFEAFFAPGLASIQQSEERHQNQLKKTNLTFPRDSGSNEAPHLDGIDPGGAGKGGDGSSRAL